MIGNTRFLHKLNIALYLFIFTFGANASVSVRCRVLTLMDITALKQGIDLAVSDYHFAQALGLKHRRAHHFIVLNPSSVVRKGTDALCHILHIRERLALLAFGNGAVRNDVYNGVAFDNIKLLFKILGAVGHGVEVRHRANRAVTALRRRLRSRLYCLFIRKARLSEMHVNITKTGKNNVFAVIGENRRKNAALISFGNTYRKQLAVIQNCIVDRHFHSSPTFTKGRKMRNDTTFHAKVILKSYFALNCVDHLPQLNFCYYITFQCFCQQKKAKICFFSSFF